MQTILVTGGLGYIGSYLVVELLKYYNIIIVDNTTDSHKLINIKKLTSKFFLFYPYDIRSSAFEKVFHNHIDKVIHLTNFNNKSNNNSLDYYDNNVNGTINLLKLMEKYNINDIIYNSSALLYENNIKITENSKINPTSPYLNSIYMVEQILKDFNINCVILRYFNVINPSDLDNENDISLLYNAIKQGTPFIIQGNDYNTLDGTFIRDYIHMMDLVKCHLTVLDKKSFNIYNLTAKGVSVLNIINAMENVIGSKINYVYGPRINDFPKLVCNADKIKNELGYICEYNINDICRDIIKNKL